MAAILQCSNICKTYSAFSLKSISLTLESGYITGMIGVNGAGKSTLLNILAGIEPKYEGSVIVDGSDLRKDFREAKQKLALVSERISCFMDKNALENGQMLGKYFEKWSMETFYEWLDRLEIPKGQPLYQLSKGMYMKYLLAFAMSYEAKFLLLDEPTAGFDPVFRKDFMRILQEVRDKEIGILMSTHILSDIEHIADTVLVIENGELRQEETNVEGQNLSKMLQSGKSRGHIGELLNRKR